MNIDTASTSDGIEGGRSEYGYTSTESDRVIILSLDFA